jgi:hypothetical protein
MPELDVVPATPQEETPESRHKADHGHAPALTRKGSAESKARPERRRERRHKGPRQVWIQGTDIHGGAIEEVQIMQNYSRGGFYFVTSMHCYSVGMRLNVIPAFGSLNLEFVAEVVRVEPKPRMAYGVGVKLLHARDTIAPQPR